MSRMRRCIHWAMCKSTLDFSPNGWAIGTCIRRLGAKRRHISVLRRCIRNRRQTACHRIVHRAIGQTNREPHLLGICRHKKVFSTRHRTIWALAFALRWPDRCNRWCHRCKLAHRGVVLRRTLGVFALRCPSCNRIVASKCRHYGRYRRYNCTYRICRRRRGDRRLLGRLCIDRRRAFVRSRRGFRRCRRYRFRERLRSILPIRIAWQKRAIGLGREQARAIRQRRYIGRWQASTPIYRCK